MFKQDSKADLAASRERARQPLKRICREKDLEIDAETFYPASTDFPKRPPWDPTMLELSFTKKYFLLFQTACTSFKF
jgi:hypothetical protein